MQRVVRSTSLLTQLAMLALFVVGMGLQQRLMICDHGEGPHLEFRHAPGECCDDVGDASRIGEDQRGGCGPTLDATCEHTSFAVDLAPSPASPTVVPPLAPNAAATFVATTPTAATLTRSHRPPGRDPPWHDPGTSIRTTTRLLL